MVLTDLLLCCLAVGYSWRLQLEHGRCYKHQRLQLFHTIVNWKVHLLASVANKIKSGSTVLPHPSLTTQAANLPYPIAIHMLYIQLGFLLENVMVYLPIKLLLRNLHSQQNICDLLDIL